MFESLLVLYSATVCSELKHAPISIFSIHKQFYNFLCSRSTGRMSTTLAARCASTIAKCKIWTLSTITTSPGITPTRIFRPATPVWMRHRSLLAANCCSWVPVPNRVPEYPVSIVKFIPEIFNFNHVYLTKWIAFNYLCISKRPIQTVTILEPKTYKEI